MFVFPMRQRIFYTAAMMVILLVVTPQPQHGAGQEQAPWFGTWRLNLAKSNGSYKRATCRIEPWEDGLKVTYDMVGVRGGVTHMEWTGRFDGKDYPMQGVDNVLTNAYRRIDDRTYEIVVKVDSAVVATSRVVVSPDGKTLRVSTQERNPNGQITHTTAVYEKF